VTSARSWPAATRGPSRAETGVRVERHENHPLSPAGQIDGLGDLAAGLRTNRPGRRRALRMLAALVLVVMAGTALVFLIV
jgi:hypothetical protein